jgi:hypothetical protein
MNHTEEYELYLTDREAWARYVAPKWVEMLKAANPAEKRALWNAAGPELRAELNRLAKKAA